MLGSSGAGAQATHALVPMQGRVLEHEFSRAISAREMSDGSVLIADEGEERVLLADFATGRVRDVARRGDGPGEFRQVSRLFPLGGDSTVMPDAAQRRWVLFVGARAVATWSASVPVVRASAGAFLQGLVTGGNAVVVEHVPSHLREASMAAREGRAVRMISQRTGEVSQIATVHRQTLPVRSESDGAIPASSLAATSSGSKFYANVRALDQVAVLAGVIIIARHAPYRLTRCHADGNGCFDGPVVPHEVGPVGARRHAILARQNTIGVNATPRTNPALGVEWPDPLPPFAPPPSRAERSAVLIAPTGHVLVQRLPRDSSGVEYDVFGLETLAREAVLKVPMNVDIIGVGSRALYAVTVDENGLQHMARYVWPLPPV